jgi:hypothetical protein
MVIVIVSFDACNGLLYNLCDLMMDTVMFCNEHQTSYLGFVKE